MTRDEKRSTRWILAASTALTTIMVTGASTSFAQDASDTSTPAEMSQQSSEMIPEIMVTATRRTTTLQQAAVSVTPVSGLELKSQGISQPGDLAGIAPGVKFQPTFLLLTYIRGIGNYSSQPGVDQSIAYNVDGIYVDRPYAMPNILFDLARVEIRRGPQGTLQGRNAIAGSIDLISEDPVLGEFDSSVSMTAGNYSRLTLEGMVNVPLADNAALRVAAASNDRSGYMDNGFWDSNTQGTRVSLLAAPTSRLEVLLRGEFTRRDEMGPSYSPCPPGSTDAACEGVEWDPWAGQEGQGTDGVLSIDEENFVFAENYALSAEVTYDTGLGTLTWIPSYRHVDYRNHTTQSHSFGYAPAVDDEFIYQELRLDSDPSSAINWTAGLYYTRQESEEQNYFTTAAGPAITVDEPGFPEVGHVYFKNDIDDYVYRSYSAFAHVAVPLFDGFRAVGGLRYTDDKKSISGRQGLVVAGPSLISAPYNAQFDLDKVTYKAGFEYDVASDVMFYANIGTGFKSGGPNGVPEGGGLRSSFAPEEILAYQAGVKSRFMDGRAQVNAEAFYYDLEGYQTSVLLPGAGGLLVGGTLNSQEARFYGGEIEGQFLITPQDQLRIDFAYLSAKHERFFIPETGLDLSGQPVSNAPKFTFSADYSHTFELKNGGDIVANVETRYEDEQWVDYRLFPAALQDGFWQHSANVTYNSPDDRWSLGAFVRNITDNGALQHALTGLGPQTVGHPYQPRTYGMRLSADF